MHALANRQVSVDLDAYDLARIQQPSSYPSPLYISPSAKPVFVCSRIVDYSIFDYPWVKQLEAISGRPFLDDIEPEFATLFALRAQALDITGQQISDVMSTALGALTEQGFPAKQVDYLCNDIDMEIQILIEFGVHCTFEQFIDVSDHMLERVLTQHANPLADLIMFDSHSIRAENDAN